MCTYIIWIYNDERVDFFKYQSFAANDVIVNALIGEIVFKKNFHFAATSIPGIY